MEETIRFNWPYSTGKEIDYINFAIKNRKLSGNGIFTKKCQEFFESKYGFEKTLLTTSCTDALEMAALLLDVNSKDEIIVPGYTFVSSALAFTRCGAKPVFVDSQSNHPNLDADLLEGLITERTKAIVVVHYAGVACDMDRIMQIAKKHNIWVVEDAAQAIDAFYKTSSPLGSIGHLATFSFHETKNISCGEGGLLVVNDRSLINRAEILWEKGTDRTKFFRGEIDKYGWVDTGSSFLPSEINAAYLYAQLEHLNDIQEKRLLVWEWYYECFLKANISNIKLPLMPQYATNNAHMFYVVVKSLLYRTELIEFLSKHNVNAVFHYSSLNKSKYYLDHYGNTQPLQNSDFYSSSLLRLPFYYGLSKSAVEYIVALIKQFDESYK